MTNQLFKKITLVVAVTLTFACFTLDAQTRRYHYDGKYGRRPNERIRYVDRHVDKRVRHDHRVKVEVKRPHRDLYTALDVINTVANVVDAFTPDTPTVVQTNTVVPPAPAYQAPVVQPTYVQPTYTEPTYQAPIVQQPTYVQPPVVENNTYVQQTVQTEPVYTQPMPQAPIVQPVVVPQTPMVVPQPVVTTPPMVIQPPVQNNTTIVVPPANNRPYRRPFLPPRYYNRPARVPHYYWR